VDRVRGALWGIHIADALSMPGVQHRRAKRSEGSEGR
jgi:hypothetical protein